MSSDKQKGATDRWGHEVDRNDCGDSDGGVSWMMLVLVILLMLALAGGGLMFYRARQMAELAAVEAARAEEARYQLELSCQAAEKAAKDLQDKAAKEASDKTVP